MRMLPTIILAAFSLVCLAQSASASKIYRKDSFYTISGNTAAELDRSMSGRGPFLKTTGSRHPGATRLKFVPNIKLVKDGRYCKVARADIDIQANVLLPRWKQRNSTRSAELAIIWDVLYRDIRRHEESHIIIARAHASEMEHAIRSLYYRKDCKELQADINKVVNRIMRKQDRAQAYFERVETLNFEKRFSRLLNYRLQQLEGK